MKIGTKIEKRILGKSNLPASDYTANPYVGCPHRCKYCYASFMKRFTGHTELWGEFLDVKDYETDKMPKDLSGKLVLMSSVTDPYNPFERKYKRTRMILEKLAYTEADVEILTKSDLVTRDIDILRSMPRVSVGISLNTLDDTFRADMEPCTATVDRRLNALKTLHENGISTYLFISPIFPYITDIHKLTEAAMPFVDKICFENLNLRGESKREILSYISEKHPRLLRAYEDIYIKGNMAYWSALESEIEEMSKASPMPLINFFYHNKIRKNGGNNND